MDYLNLKTLFNSLLYSILGIAAFWASFWLLDRMTPYKLWQQIVQEKNQALGILVGCMCLGIAIIIAAAIHG